MVNSSRVSNPNPTACVIGLGLIGASFAAALRESDAYRRVIGWDIRPEAMISAFDNQWITDVAESVAEAVQDADLVILATYIQGIIDTIDLISPYLKANTLVMDVGSTKGAIVSALNRLPESIQAMGGHPMTGRLTSGVQGVHAELFRERVFILTPTERSTEATIQQSRHLTEDILGAKVIILPADQHDHFMAIVSHLAPILPIALLNTVHETAEQNGNDLIWQLAAGGFRELTRQAEGDLGFWWDVLATNRDGLPKAIRALATQLESLAQQIEAGDADALRQRHAQAQADWHRRYRTEDAPKRTTQSKPVIAPLILMSKRDWRDHHMKKTVAYLGIKGAYSEEAARRYFGDDIKDMQCQSFDQIFEALESGDANYGILPIENSLAGTVSQSYELLTNHDVSIQGEIILPIEHALLALPGVTLKELKQVRSHPQGLAQCAQFIKQHGLEPINWYNTAGSAKDLADDPAPTIGAIASARVAELYGLDILATDIQDVSNNLTRFFVLGHDALPPTEHNKTSIIFTCKHEPGALALCLNILAERSINLSKIESRPQRDNPWQYIFYIDFEGHKNDAKSQTALEALAEQTEFLRVLGSYPSAVADRD